MWNSVKSIKLSAIFTKVVIVLIIAFAIALPIIKSKASLADGFTLTGNDINYVLPIIYICAVFALIALWSLNKLLTNIKKDMVFVDSNVKVLRTISWCCLFAAAVLIFGSYFSLTFLLLSVMAGFVGLILRVVKNVFEAAVQLKAENDYTI